MRDGGPTYGRPTPEQRLFEVARRMTPGTVGGLVRSAAPVQRPAASVQIHREATTSKETVLSYASYLNLTGVFSPRFYLRTTALLTSVFASLGNAGTSNTVVTIYKNGSSIGTLTFGSGVYTATATFSAKIGRAHV